MKNYGTIVFLLSGILMQTSIFALTLLLAYYFWNAPNASLIIGTIWPLLITTFCILSIFHNLVIRKSKSLLKWIASIVFFLLISIFFFFPSWSYLLMIGISAIIVLIPLFLKSLYRI